MVADGAAGSVVVAAGVARPAAAAAGTFAGSG
jgi:hypothetical protein